MGQLCVLVTFTILSTLLLWGLYSYVTLESVVWMKLFTAVNFMVLDFSQVSVNEVRVTTTLTYF